MGWGRGTRDKAAGLKSPQPRDEAEPRSPPRNLRHLPGPQGRSPQPAMSPSSRPAPPAPIPASGTHARVPALGADTALEAARPRGCGAEGCGAETSPSPHAGLWGRAEGTGAADTRDSPSGPALSAGEGTCAGRRRASDPQHPPQRSTSGGCAPVARRRPQHPPKALSCGPAARGRRSQSEQGNGWGRGLRCRPAPPRPLPLRTRAPLLSAVIPL